MQMYETIKLLEKSKNEPASSNLKSMGKSSLSGQARHTTFCWPAIHGRWNICELAASHVMFLSDLQFFLLSTECSDSRKIMAVVMLKNESIHYRRSSLSTLPSLSGLARGIQRALLLCLWLSERSPQHLGQESLRHDWHISISVPIPIWAMKFRNKNIR